MTRVTFPQTFRPAPWLIALVLIGLALFAGLAVFTIRTQGYSLLALGLSAGSVLAFLGLTDALSTRVTLHEDAIEVVGIFRKRRVARADIARVVAEKGAPIALELSAGGWFKVPDLGGRLHPNTLRAWLKAGSRWVEGGLRAD